MIHNLKTIPPWFEYAASGKKTFEIRKDDRGFKVGDVLILREYNPALPDGTRFTGRSVAVDVVLLLDSDDVKGIQDGYVVLEIKKIEEPR